MAEKAKLKDIFKDKHSNRITVGVAVLGLLGAYAAGVEPTTTKFVLAGLGLGAVKYGTGRVSVELQQLGRRLQAMS